MRLLHLLPRLLISIGIPLVVFAADTAVEWRDYQSAWQANWQERKQGYASNLERCERIRNGLLPDSDMKCDSSESSASNQRSSEKFPPEVFAFLDRKSCELHKKGDTKALLQMFSCNVESTPPSQDPLLAYTWDHQLKQKAGGFVVIAIAIFVAMTVIKLYRTQRSIGWKRLSLVASAVISGGITYLIKKDAFEAISSTASADLTIESLLTYAVSFMSLSLAFLLGKSIFDWIREGFGVDRGNSLTPTNKASPEKMEVWAEEEHHEKDRSARVAASNSSGGVVSDVTSSSTSNATDAKKSRTDDEVSESLLEDVDSPNRMDMLWARCLAEAEGDTKKAKASYIKNRFEQKDEVSESLLEDVDSPNRIDALWARCLAEAEGDTKKANARYIQIRFEQMVNGIDWKNETGKER